MKCLVCGKETENIVLKFKGKIRICEECQDKGSNHLKNARFSSFDQTVHVAKATTKKPICGFWGKASKEIEKINCRKCLKIMGGAL